jgi:hypothetical protein
VDDFEAFAMREFVVFYAWQSDRPAEITRFVIRDALEVAAKNITNDAPMKIQVRIDSDTQDVLGHVPVIDTILEKIDVCDAFVPDLTFVAVTEDDKRVPNPNVLLEYGYALHAKTHSIMIPVMNTEYGVAEKLPLTWGTAGIHFNFTYRRQQQVPTDPKPKENRVKILRKFCASGSPRRPQSRRTKSGSRKPKPPPLRLFSLSQARFSRSLVSLRASGSIIGSIQTRRFSFGCFQPTQSNPPSGGRR